MKLCQSCCFQSLLVADKEFGLIVKRNFLIFQVVVLASSFHFYVLVKVINITPGYNVEYWRISKLCLNN